MTKTTSVDTSDTAERAEITVEAKSTETALAEQAALISDDVDDEDDSDDDADKTGGMGVIKFTVHVCKVGVVFFGGCGMNILRMIIDTLLPEDYPNFYLFGFEADASTIEKNFGDGQTDEQKARLQLWMDKKQISIHQLGPEVTDGEGSGALPEVGRQAAMTKDSMATMRKFFKFVKKLIIVFGAGGGTGTGAAPVAAKLAVKLGMEHSTLAIPIMPFMDEFRTIRATKVLNAMNALVPTLAFMNSQLEGVQKATMKEEDIAKATSGETREMISNKTIIPTLLILREIFHATGDINVDGADSRNVSSRGHNASIGKVDLDPKNVHLEPAEKIVDELLAGFFQDSSAIASGKGVILWIHGPVPHRKIKEVSALVSQRINAKSIKSGEEGAEVFEGNIEKVKDNKMWIAIFVVGNRTRTPSDPLTFDAPRVSDVIGMAPQVPSLPPAEQLANALETGEIAEQAPNTSFAERWPTFTKIFDRLTPVSVDGEEAIPEPQLTLDAEESASQTEQTPAAAPASVEAEVAVPVQASTPKGKAKNLRSISFRSDDGVLHEPAIDADLAKRFIVASRDKSYSPEDLEPLYRQVEHACGFMPRMRQDGQPKADEKNATLDRPSS